MHRFLTATWIFILPGIAFGQTTADVDLQPEASGVPVVERPASELTPPVDPAIAAMERDMKTLKLEFIKLKTNIDAAAETVQKYESRLGRLESDLNGVLVTDLPKLREDLSEMRTITDAATGGSQFTTGGLAEWQNQLEDEIDRIKSGEGGPDASGRLDAIEVRLGEFEDRIETMLEVAKVGQPQTGSGGNSETPQAAPVISRSNGSASGLDGEWQARLDESGALVSMLRRDVSPDDALLLVAEAQCAEAGDWFSEAFDIRDYNAFFVSGARGIRVCEKGSLGWRPLNAAAVKRAHLVFGVQ